MVTIKAEPLTVESFKPFGSIISPSEQLTIADTNANQGTAIKQRKVSALTNGFATTSNVHAKDHQINFNIFQCFPQIQLAQQNSHVCKILEKHPFSSQTFIPMCGDAQNEKQYLIIVANGTDKPDLSTVKAFFVKGDQAVTYGMGTWHAPMIVVDRTVTFAVAIAECDVDELDCVEDPSTEITVEW